MDSYLERNGASQRHCSAITTSQSCGSHGRGSPKSVLCQGSKKGSSTLSTSRSVGGLTPREMIESPSRPLWRGVLTLKLHMAWDLEFRNQGSIAAGSSAFGDWKLGMYILSVQSCSTSTRTTTYRILLRQLLPQQQLLLLLRRRLFLVVVVLVKVAVAAAVAAALGAAVAAVALVALVAAVAPVAEVVVSC